MKIVNYKFEVGRTVGDENFKYTIAELMCGTSRCRKNSELNFPDTWKVSAKFLRRVHFWISPETKQ